jgi:hypothetical protein
MCGDSMCAANPAESDSLLFFGGPPLRLEERMHLCQRGDARVLRRSALVILVGWVPIVALVAVQPLLLPAAGLSALGSDLAVHCRSLIAAPLLVIAEASCTPRLAAMARHFLDAGLIREHDRPRFERAKASTRRLRDAPAAEIAVVMLAYAMVGALLYASGAKTPEWHQGSSGPLGPCSPAGWWHTFISLPLLLVLFLGSLWRVFLWARFLWLMSRLDLRLVPAHPDLAAGLKFVSYSIRAFSPVGLAIGVVVAGTVANGVLVRGDAPHAHAPTVLGLMVFVVIVFCGPVTIFWAKLRQAWSDGVFRYGAIAGGMGRTFEHKWLEGKQITESALAVPDFSEVADLYQVVSNVYQMKLVPIEAWSVVTLVVMTSLPILGVVLFSLPLHVVLEALGNLLL